MQRRQFVLLAAGALAACRRQPVSARVDAAIVPLLPHDARSLAGLRLDKLRDTPFYRRYVEGKQLRQLEDFAKRTGIDPRKDLWELCIVNRGPKSLVFARGKFGELFGQEPQIRIEGMRRMSYKGYGILGTPEYGVMFLQSGVAAAGDLLSLYAVIDGRDAANQPPQALLDLVATLPASAHFWVVASDGRALAPGLPREGNAVNFARMITSLDRFTLAADLNLGLKLAIDGHYPDPALAKQAHDALRGLIGLARLQTRDDQPDLLRLYDSIQVQNKEGQVTLALNAPLELIDNLLSLLA